MLAVISRPDVPKWSLKPVMLSVSPDPHRPGEATYVVVLVVVAVALYHERGFHGENEL